MPKIPHTHLVLRVVVGSLLLIIGYNYFRESWNAPLPDVDLLDYVDPDLGTASPFNCSSFLVGDTEEIAKAKLFLHSDFHKRVGFSDEDYIHATRDCE